jgi:type IV secretory pathway VirJ component
MGLCSVAWAAPAVLASAPVAASASTTALTSASTSSSGGVKTIPGGLFGDVIVAKPVGPMRGFVVLYSDKTGWHENDQRLAQQLAEQGAMVVGVDTARYAQTLTHHQEDKSGCHYLVGDAEAVSHQLQREAHSSQYFLPILAGIGQGALVAEHTLGRAPSNTIDGAVIVDPDPTAKLDARFNPCGPDATIDRGNGLTGFFTAGQTNDQHVVATISTGGKPLVTQHFSKGTTAEAALLSMITPHLKTLAAPADDDVSDLPLVELPAAQPSDLLAIVISGDGGWRDLDKTIAESLQKKGVNVIGVDALRYFWSEKTPEQTTHDMARLLRVYGNRWHSRHFALIGYSFGADVMPFVYNRLPEGLRAQVSQLSLLGFAPKADFQIRVTGWLGLPASEAALEVMPETTKIPAYVLQCFYGESEDDTACPDLVKSGLVKQGASVVKLDGGHHFGGDYGDIAQQILTRWQAQIGATH